MIPYLVIYIRILFCNHRLSHELVTKKVFFEIVKLSIKTRQKFAIYFKNEDFSQKV